MTLAKPITDLPVAEKFWSFVNIGNPDECWEWNRRGRNGKYGFLRTSDGTVPAHRLAYALSKGIPAPEDVVCHHCDNPPCCNPSHLYIGTHSTNAQDRETRNRRDKNHPNRLAALKHGDDHWAHQHPEYVRRGEDCPQSPLTADIVREIRTRYAQGNVTQKTLSEEYGIKTSSLNSIIMHKTWQHTDDIQPPADRHNMRNVEGRHAHGTYGAHAILSASDVQRVRVLHKQGATINQLAQDYGVHRDTIRNIILRKSWTDLPDC